MPEEEHYHGESGNPHLVYPISGGHYPMALATARVVTKRGELEIKISTDRRVEGFDIDDPEDFAFLILHISAKYGIKHQGTPHKSNN